VVIVSLAGVAAIAGFALVKPPAVLAPPQDKGHLLVNVQLEDSASPEQAHMATRSVEAIARRTKGVAHTVAISGHSFLLNTDGSNLGSAFLVLESHDRRAAPALRADSIAEGLRQTYRREVPEASIGVHGLPPLTPEWTGPAHPKVHGGRPAVWFLLLCAALAALTLLVNTGSRQAALSAPLVAPLGVVFARLGVRLAGCRTISAPRRCSSC
jgi:hypothetical protein